MSIESNLLSTNTSSSEGSSSKKIGNENPGGTSESRACAACKYQRRRCIPDCPLAPYFPADNQQQFLNAHKLFGLRNLRKVLKNMKPPEKDIAIKTMIIQANVRANDPVGGCFRLVKELREQLNSCTAELHSVVRQLSVYREQALQINETSNGGIGQETENGSSVDDALNFSNFYNGLDVSDQGFDYNGHPNTFEGIPDRSEDIKLPVDGSSSEKFVVPKVEPESSQTHIQPQTDLKNAASQFSLKNINS